MNTLIDVILPVFLLVGSGYIAVWSKILGASIADGLMMFAQKIAIPCLLFNAISNLDLGQEFDAKLLYSYYGGVIAGFTIGLLGARLLFNRAWPDCVAIGFVGMFSNSVMLGLPITERAFGAAAMEPSFAIMSIHAPFCYMMGVTIMEIVRGNSNGFWPTATSILRSLSRNSLVIGVACGLFANFTGLQLPAPAHQTLDMLVRTALPVALFGLGGILVQYRPEGDLKTILFIVAVSLILHPAVTFGLGHLFDLSDRQLRAAVLLAGVAPGVNVYIFADIYGVAKRVAASAVLVGTIATALTSWAWLAVLP